MPWFSSVCGLPSPTSAEGCPSLFGSLHRYYATVRLLRRVHVRITALRLLGPACRLHRRDGGLPVLVHVVSQRARGLRLRGIPPALAMAHRRMWPSPHVHRVGIPERSFRSSIPGPPMPLSMLRLPPRDDRRKTRGQDGSLLLSCRALSSPTTCRFIPAHGRPQVSNLAV